MKQQIKIATAITGLFLSLSLSATAQSTGDNTYVSGRFLGWGATSGNLDFRVNGSTKMVLQNTTGYFGINQPIPSERLDVIGNIRVNDNAIYFRTAGDINHGIGYRGTNLFAGFSIDGPVAFGWSGGGLGSTGGGEKLALRWDASGNVGIATNTPKEALQIGDRFTFHNGGMKAVAYNFTYNGGDKRILADYASGVFFNASGAIVFRNAPSGAAGSAITWTNSMTVGNDGKVLIGNPSLAGFQGTPGTYLLYVQKGILTEKVKIGVATTADWSDYVFAKEYKLKSIEELDAFVKEHKHLPNVPSAKEVVKEGIDVAKMDAKLLEKIEELSLYIIQLKQENIALVKRMEKMENK